MTLEYSSVISHYSSLRENFNNLSYRYADTREQKKNAVVENTIEGNLKVAQMFETFRHPLLDHFIGEVWRDGNFSDTDNFAAAKFRE